MESGFSALPWESGFCFQPWNLGFLFCYRTRGWQGLAQFLANGLRFQYLLWQLVEFHAFLCAGRWRRGRLGPETSVVKPPSAVGAGAEELEDAEEVDGVLWAQGSKSLKTQKK